MKYHIEIWLNKISVNGKSVSFYYPYKVNTKFIVMPKRDYISKTTLFNLLCTD
jgi:hypothetical protein